MADATKRAKKAAKFRARSKGDAVQGDEDVGVEDAVEQVRDQVEAPVRVSEERAEQDPVARTKRKKTASASTKTTFSEDGAAHEAPAEPTVPKLEHKYIVFVGNMPFNVTKEMLAKHLGDTCGETPSVRLLTKRADPKALEGLSNSKKKSIAKGKAQNPCAPVSRGCAFAEFGSATALQKALRFHHSMFHGRQINVELTAGGGGKGEQRQAKIKSKNAELEKERRKHFEKHVKPEADAHKRKLADAPTAHWEKTDKDAAPAKRAKFVSGANAVRLG
ncbi:hypothetical protein MVES1_003241 [Malassezia vespertilionis]|uniref:RRM domain-containing protein n=1 Tax=Malassezia vespertilionis TaxID=2020962 RepID=A0A2N1J9F1_9BASI|nr:uncharacterized protein MVES1_003241 [Malassezia vespertilionis]PKI83181.1 hypothetical protein MVES_003080 [Malassezia vespertilionis]WFD07873.1 hypothetical protein MVES1_003241 [Malassezia vespertilionis]